MNTLVNDIVILILALLPIDAFKNMLITNKYYASYYYLWEYRYKLLNAAIDLPGDFYDQIMYEGEMWNVIPVTRYVHGMQKGLFFKNLKKNPFHFLKT